VVLVVQEIFGVHEYIKDVCRRLAKAGYMAVAPELYARQGDTSKMTNVQEILETVVAKVPDAQVLGDLDAAALGQQRTAATPTNWRSPASAGAGASCGCMPRTTQAQGGGRLVWPTHRRQGHAASAASMEIANALKAQCSAVRRGRSGHTVEVVEMFQDDSRGESKSEIVVYPDAPHGFHADYRPSYRQDRPKMAGKSCRSGSRSTAWCETARPPRGQETCGAYSRGAGNRNDDQQGDQQPG